MRYVIRGRLRASCQLSPEEYFTLAVREWELVLSWIARGKALGYGRLGTPSGGTILVEADSEAEVRALARALPFAPYAEMTISHVDHDAVERALGPPLFDRPAAGAAR